VNYNRRVILLQVVRGGKPKLVLQERPTRIISSSGSPFIKIKIHRYPVA
jgi:hypothetical protein